MDQMAPNLFIPGAAKCGSSSLYAILRQHEDIHAPAWKEPTFFNWPHQFVGNPLMYFRMFDSPKRYKLDASVNYLANPLTARVLCSLFPNAKFLITLRNPKARAYSLYRFMRRIGSEDSPTFAHALKEEANRYSSPAFFMNCMWDLWNYLYIRSSLYDMQLTRYFDAFPREQIHIISLAQLSKEPIATTERILRFLELDPSQAKHFKYEIVNRDESGCPPYDEESNDLMDLRFEGLTERTDRLVGHALDWSL